MSSNIASQYFLIFLAATVITLATVIISFQYPFSPTLPKVVPTITITPTPV